jgi:cytochrome c5
MQRRESYLSNSLFEIRVLTFNKRSLTVYHMKLFKSLKINIFFVFTFLLGPVLLANTNISSFTERTELPLVDISGREVYSQHCSKCHGADGQGDTELGRKYEVPNIANAKWQKRHSDQKITKAIIKGEGDMPAFGEKLSKEQITALVGYIRSLKK